MKLADIGNMATFGKSSGRVRKVGNWSYYDNCEGVRIIFHYGTVMGRMVFAWDGTEYRWVFEPVSTGWGSVSDQAGMNKIIRSYGWYYSRKGGNAQYVEVK